jgi:hypothetical protein
MILLERPNIEIALQNSFMTNNAKHLLKSRVISVTQYSNQVLQDPAVPHRLLPDIPGLAKVLMVRRRFLLRFTSAYDYEMTKRDDLV